MFDLLMRGAADLTTTKASGASTPWSELYLVVAAAAPYAQVYAGLSVT